MIVAVLDADGRLAPNALIEVAPFFADPAVGGVQIGVRMYNAKEKLLARMQDFEFVTFTEVFQRARQRIGSVGLGGNGQFNRLSALRSLGSAPWTKCLTEDLDLGIQLLTRGWLNCYCPTTHVSQQAVVQFRRLVRQRSRWYQGNLQCWRRIPEIVRSGLPTAGGRRSAVPASRLVPHPHHERGQRRFPRHLWAHDREEPADRDPPVPGPLRPGRWS